MNADVAKRLVARIMGPSPDRQGWRLLAACGPSEAGDTWDPDQFWPDHIDRISSATAIEVCHDCPVRSECLLFVFSLPKDPGGVWGGTTPAMRGNLRRKHKASGRCDNCGKRVPADQVRPRNRTVNACSRGCRLELTRRRPRVPRPALT